MIQALVLLCLWPLPFGPKAADPSLMYSGLAIQAALQIGVHRYQFTADFTYRAAYQEDDAHQCKRVWVGCFIANQWLVFIMKLLFFNF